MPEVKLRFVFLFVFVLMIYVCNMLAIVFQTAFGFGAKISFLKYSLVLVLVVLPFCVFKFRDLRVNKKFLAIVLYFLCCAPYLFLGGEFSSLINNAQFVFSLPLFVLVGLTMGLALSVSSRFLVNAQCLIVLFLIIFGFIEWSLSGYFWGGMDLKEYYYGIGYVDGWNSEYELPKNWVSWDLLGLIGTGVPRMVSFISDPVGWGRVLAVTLILSWIYGVRFFNNPIVIFLSLLCMALTISKGGFLLIFLFYFGVIFGVFYQVAGVLFGLVVLIATVEAGFGHYLGPSVVNHLSSVYYAFDIISLKPLGNGLAVDHVSHIYDLISEAEEGFSVRSEGSLALFSIMMGGVGVLVYSILFFISFPRIEKGRDMSESYYISLLCFSVMLSSLAAHSAFSIVGSGVCFILLGLSLSKEVLAKKYRSDFDWRSSCE